LKGPEESFTLKSPDQSLALKGPEQSFTLKSPEQSVALKGHDFSRAAIAPK
jgi:hypothetical protein